MLPAVTSKLPVPHPLSSHRGVIEKATEAGNLDMTRRLYEMLQPTRISHGAKAVVVSALVNLTRE